MRRVATIARRDFVAYFHGPAGAVVGALFLTLQGLVMWMFVRYLARPDAPPGAVMEFFFGGTMLYWISAALLATVIPMRLLAEESRSGSMEALLTAPVTSTDVVLGKALAAFAFWNCLWAPTVLYVVFLRSAGTHVDPGPIAAGYLGTMLVGAALLAVGLLASSITRHQVLAATFAFVAVFVVLLLGAMEGQVASPGAAAVLRRLSLFRMMEDFGRGLVDTRHVVALTTLAASALAVARSRVAALRWPGVRGHGRATRGLRAAFASLSVVAIAVAANLLAGRFYVRADWTSTQVYGLGDQTVSVLRGLPQRVEVTAFFHSDSEDNRALAGMAHETLQRFQREAAGRLTVDIVDPERQPARAEALQKRFTLSEHELADGALVFESGDRSKLVTRDDMVEYDEDDPYAATRRIKAWKTEAAFLDGVLTVAESQPAEICFSQGHGEPDIASFDDGGYAYLADELRRQGDRPRAVDHLAVAGGLASCAILVVAEPQTAFSAPEADTVEGLLEGGGRLLLMLGPRFDRAGKGFARIGLEALAERWGARFGDDLLVDPAHASDLEGPSVWSTAGRAAYGDHPLAARMSGRPTAWPRSRTVRPVSSATVDARVLVSTSADGWAETDLATIRGETDLAFDAGRDAKGPVPVAVAAEARGHAGAPGAGTGPRVVFLGTGQLVTNGRLGGVLVRDYNRDFVLSALAWLAHREARMGVAPKTPGSVRLSADSGTVQKAFRLFVLGLPLACLGLAILVAVRRRH